MTATPPAPAALALSAEQIARLIDPYAFEREESVFIKEAMNAAHRILAALAAPAPAVVGEDIAGLEKMVNRLLETRNTLHRKIMRLKREIRHQDTAQRPSRDDDGEAVAWHSERLAPNGYWYPHISFEPPTDSRLFRNVRPLYAHPPAPAAENGRVALQKVRSVLANAFLNGDSGKPTAAQMKYMQDVIDAALSETAK